MSRYHANELLNNRTNDIQHWKYVKKISVGKGYRYFYSWDEYKAYLKDPTAELNKVQNKASTEIKNTRTKAEKYVAKGRKKAEQLTKSRRSSNVSVSAVKQINASRKPSVKERIQEIGKKASEKWNKDKESVKRSVERAKNWLPNKIKDYKEERERKRKEELNNISLQKDKLAKKYKYLAKKTINGKTVYFYSQEELDAWGKKQQYIQNEPDFMKDVKKSDVPYTKEEDAILVNPRYDDPFTADYNNNCAECTAIYELRRRGYDVESNGMSGLDPEAVKYNTDKRYDLFYENPEINRLKPTKTEDETVRELEKEFAKMPPGSRGDISFKWAGYNGAHSIVWEKDSNGEVHFIDAQPSGRGYKMEYDYESLAKAMDTTSSYKRKDFKASDKTFFNRNDKVSSVRIVRTDNLQLKSDIKNICQDSDGVKNKPATGRNAKWERGSLGKKDEFNTMSEKELVTKYPNLYDPRKIKQYNKDQDKYYEYYEKHKNDY